LPTRENNIISKQAHWYDPDRDYPTRLSTGTGPRCK